MSDLEKVLPGVYVELGGKKRRILFNWFAVGRLELEGGEAFIEKALKKMTPARLFLLLWAGLVWDERGLDGPTPEQRLEGQRQVTQWCEGDVDFSALAESVCKALAHSSPAKAMERKNSPGEKEASQEPTG